MKKKKKRERVHKGLKTNRQGSMAPSSQQLPSLKIEGGFSLSLSFFFCGGVGGDGDGQEYHSLLQEIFLSQGSDPDLPHCRWKALPPELLGKSRRRFLSSQSFVSAQSTSCSSRSSVTPCYLGPPSQLG